MARKSEKKRATGEKTGLLDLIRKRSESDANADPKDAFRKYSILKKKHLLDIQTWKYKLRNKHHPLSSIKVNMELSNGEVMPFVTTIKDGGFVFDKGFYIVDENAKYFDNNARMWCFDYHEELCFPVKKQIRLHAVKEEVYSGDDVELETAINPKSLQKFMESTVIQKLLAGAEMEDSLARIKMFCLVTLVVTAATLLIVINMSGLLGG